jgi:hypothetical protein
MAHERRDVVNPKPTFGAGRENVCNMSIVSYANKVTAKYNKDTQKHMGAKAHEVTAGMARYNYMETITLDDSLVFSKRDASVKAGSKDANIIQILACTWPKLPHGMTIESPDVTQGYEESKEGDVSLASPPKHILYPALPEKSKRAGGGFPEFNHAELMAEFRPTKEKFLEQCSVIDEMQKIERTFDITNLVGKCMEQAKDAGEQKEEEAQFHERCAIWASKLLKHAGGMRTEFAEKIEFHSNEQSGEGVTIQSGGVEEKAGTIEKQCRTHAKLLLLYLVRAMGQTDAYVNFITYNKCTVRHKLEEVPGIAVSELCMIVNPMVADPAIDHWDHTYDLFDELYRSIFTHWQNNFAEPEDNAVRYRKSYKYISSSPDNRNSSPVKNNNNNSSPNKNTPKTSSPGSRNQRRRNYRRSGQTSSPAASGSGLNVNRRVQYDGPDGQNDSGERSYQQYHPHLQEYTHDPPPQGRGYSFQQHRG